ncbi:hypothetical protein PLICRDRAFT_527481 [Plicaturopsis crispa FD-325 SS-3]|uniref:Ubiquitin-like protease family profile domain-containing protein n=1 Tax=Plicaturopsis crispa FD-325 SS-3 TaxID=944288 RepID=A0A0C9SK09_PLICR|nr:hypothetical protein PLICRDRAFT_527481 [Plicaturopsis crispa FD-325 SS-3]
MAEISAAVHCWTAAERWLTSKEKVRVERTRKAARDFRVQLFTLPWQGHTHGFSDQEPVRIISAFCSRDWLSDAHENFFLELLRRDIASDPNSAFVTEIVLTWFTRSILKAYSGRASADYAAQRDSGVGALVRLGLDIEAGRTHSLGTIAHIHSNHWVGLIIDILTHAVLFGDPLGHDPPDDLKAAINWWLEQHTFSPYTWGVLPCTAQDDTHSCGVLTPNCIGHHYLPAKYPLIPSSQLEIDAARMEIGIEVLLQHKNALPIPIIADFSVQHEAAQFTFTSSTSTSKSPPRTPTRTGVADVLAVSFSALKVTPRVHEGALRSPTFSPSPSPVHPTWPVAAPKAKRHRQAVSPALSPEEKKKKKARSDALPTFAPLFAKAKAGAEKVKAAAKRLEGNLPSNPNASLSAPAKLSKAARAKTVAATKLPAKMRHKRARVCCVTCAAFGLTMLTSLRIVG